MSSLEKALTEMVHLMKAKSLYKDSYAGQFDPKKYTIFTRPLPQWTTLNKWP